MDSYQYRTFFYVLPILFRLISAVQAQTKEEKADLIGGWGLLPIQIRFAFYVLLMSFYVILPFVMFGFLNYWAERGLHRAFSCPRQPNKHLQGFAEILRYLEDEQAKILNQAKDETLPSENGAILDPSVYSDLYIPFEGDSFVLRRVDPDWELDSVIFGFLTEWTPLSLIGFLVAITGTVLMLIYFPSAFLYTSEVSEASWSLELFTNLSWLSVAWFSGSSFLLLFPVALIYYARNQVRDALTYIKIRSYLISQLTKQILDLSSEETLFFSREEETEREIDRKLDLMSARMSLNHLKEIPYFPLWNQFSLAIKTFGLLSLGSVIYSFLFL